MRWRSVMSDAFIKAFWEGIGWTALAVFMFFPWAIGFVDGLSVFLTGFCITNIHWETSRVMIAFWWPMFWVMMAALFGL